MSTPAQKVKVVRPALEVLGRLRGGTVMDELSHALNNVVEGVLETGKAGKLGLLITVDTVKSAPNAVIIRAEVKENPPEPPRQNDIFFADEDFNLHPNNPRQGDIFGPRPAPVPSPVAGDDFDPETGEVTSRRA